MIFVTALYVYINIELHISELLTKRYKVEFNYRTYVPTSQSL